MYRTATWSLWASADPKAVDHSRDSVTYSDFVNKDSPAYPRGGGDIGIHRTIQHKMSLKGIPYRDSKVSMDVLYDYSAAVSPVLQKLQHDTTRLAQKQNEEPHDQGHKAASIGTLGGLSMLGFSGIVRARHRQTMGSIHVSCRFDYSETLKLCTHN